MAKKKWLGCEEDCFNCQYPDCLRPENICKSIEYDAEESRGKKGGKKRKADLYDGDTSDADVHTFCLRFLRDRMRLLELRSSGLDV